jgi:hypothetical protein
LTGVAPADLTWAGQEVDACRCRNAIRLADFAMSWQLFVATAARCAAASDGDARAARGGSGGN